MQNGKVFWPKEITQSVENKWYEALGPDGEPVTPSGHRHQILQDLGHHILPQLAPGQVYLICVEDGVGVEAGSPLGLVRTHWAKVWLCEAPAVAARPSFEEE
jgi:hypothetical protein